MVRMPSNKNLEAGQYLKATSTLQQVLERDPTELEVCEYMDIDLKSAKTLQQASQYHSSLDAKVSSDDSSSALIDLMEDNNAEKPDSALMDESLKKDIYRAFEVLKDSEAKVIRYIYGIDCSPHSKEQIAQKLGYSNERIRQITRKAEKKLLSNSLSSDLLRKYL